jgi:hypothetical protein
MGRGARHAGGASAIVRPPTLKPLLETAAAGSQTDAGSLPSAGSREIGGTGQGSLFIRCSSTSLVTAATELPALSTIAFNASVEMPNRRDQART